MNGAEAFEVIKKDLDDMTRQLLKLSETLADGARSLSNGKRIFCAGAASNALMNAAALIHTAIDDFALSLELPVPAEAPDLAVPGKEGL